MEKKEKVMAIYTLLDGLYPETIVFLDQKDPFRFMVSVILSAQTTDKMVNQVVVPLFKAYPTVESLANADILLVEEIIHATGFYKMKAKNIVACAKTLVGRQIPSTIDELVKLPGVGRKTANCVLGEVFHKPAIIVDTHFGRVVQRLGIVDTKDPEKIEKEIASILDPDFQYRFSMAANLFGRTTCHAKKPSCPICPLVNLCPSADAFLKGSSKE
ncbi:endonuclease III domain-containing protein [uncultured Sphaerochaeta sp.]|uniref:endonuclease III domain-containing protein n=1 Tax=uncultured Sphaerochaeta sp. TaxID=886478 RepID=UPI003747ED9B